LSEYYQKDKGNILAKCPDCKKEISKAKKTWNYGSFRVQAFTCDCGTDFREYSGKQGHAFTLKRKRTGGGFRKA
jgi:hypothetical protein